MQTEETKNSGTKNGSADFGCCNPKDFINMSEKKWGCCSGRSGTTDFSVMKEGMMKKMMEMCCGSKAEETKTNTKS